MKGKLNHSRPIIGYTSSTTVMLDLDNMCKEEAKHWALKVCEEFGLGGFLDLESSERNYHIVFNERVSWAKNMSIVASACVKMKREELIRWFLLQCRKRESTLRLSVKGEKTAPRIVFRYGKQDGKIRDYLLHRRRIKDMIRKLAV